MPEWNAQFPGQTVSVTLEAQALEICQLPRCSCHEQDRVVPPSIYYEGRACAKGSDDDNALKAQFIMIYSAFSGLKRQTET